MPTPPAQPFIRLRAAMGRCWLFYIRKPVTNFDQSVRSSSCTSVCLRRRKLQVLERSDIGRGALDWHQRSTLWWTEARCYLLSRWEATIRQAWWAMDELKSHGPGRFSLLWRAPRTRVLAVAVGALLSVGCASGNRGVSAVYLEQSPGKPNDAPRVDCVIPGQIRQLGSQLTYLSPAKAIKTTATDCEIRGGSQPGSSAAASVSGD